MNKAIFTVGVSGSGKTYWTKVQAQKNSQLCVIERDEIREQIVIDSFDGYDRYHSNIWDFWKFTRENEAKVNKIINDKIDWCVEQKQDIIFADTNLNKKYLDANVQKMKDLGYDVELKFFPVDYDVCVKRDRERQHKVGQHIINQQWLNWLKFPTEKTGIKKYVKDLSLPKCILVDIDGTVARHIDRGPFEWSKVLTDEPIVEVVDLVNRYASTHKIIFLSGRDSVCRNDTFNWLSRYFKIDNDQLFMRPQGNFEKDSIIKGSLFWENIANNYCVEFVVDDRKQIVRYWTDIGLKVIDVGNVYEEF